MNCSRHRKVKSQQNVAARNREAGQSIVIVAAVLLVLIVAAGLAIDMGYLRYEKRRAQMAADSAAIAGASCNGTLACTTSVADQGATSASYNGFTANSTTTVSVYPGPLSGPHSGDASYVEAVITQQAPAFFMKVLGSAFSSFTVSARAVATLQQGRSCVYTTAAFNLDGGLSSNCVVDIGSDLTVLNGDSASHFIYNNGAGTTYAGNLNNPYNVPVSPVPVQGGAVADPLPSLTSGAGPAQTPPPANCGAYDFCAGYYPGGLQLINRSAMLQPGTYVFGGPLIITGHGNNVVSGSGVTFYMANGAAAYINYGATDDAPYGSNFPTYVTNCPGTSNVQPAAVVQLSAPTDGSYAGILLIQSASNNNAANIMLNNGDTCQGSGPGSDPINQAPTQVSYMWGVMDLPSANVTLFGQGLEAYNFCSVVPMFTTVIANTLRVDGHLSFGVTTSCAPPDSPTNPITYGYPFTIPDPLKAPVLVE